MTIGISLGNFTGAPGVTGGEKLAECAAEFSPSGGLALQNAVRFDGTNDRLQLNTGLTGANDTGTTFLFSLWFNFLGSDDTEFQMFGSDTDRMRLFRFAKKFRIEVRGPGGTGQRWEQTGATSFDSVTNPGWHHILIAGSFGTIGQVFIDDVVETMTGPVAPNAGAINMLDSNWLVGGSTIDQFLVNGELAELWFDDSFLDLTVVANRRKFITATGKPTILGSDGSNPTGSAPLVYLSGPTDAWHTNKAAGGGFTETGALTDAISNPGE